MLDVIITGGTVLDGTGNPGFRAAVGVLDGRVQLLRGRDLPTAARTIDAQGLVVAPGFIDMHSHSGLLILADPMHLPKVTQGVTTEVVGVDGNSYAPFRSRDDLLDFVTMNAGLDGRPELAYDWDTVASLLSRFDGAASVNLAVLVGNSALRIASVGWDDQPASPGDLADMRAMLREALAEGAFGLSTGLDYPPGSYASTEELAELCREAGRVGAIYHTHVRYWLGDKVLDPFREAFTISRLGECPLHLTHFYYKATYGTGSGPLFDLLEGEVRAGADVTFDSYPYPWSSTRLSIFLPQWIQQGGPQQLLRRLADPACRDRFKEELERTDPADEWRSFLRSVRVGNLRTAPNRRWESTLVTDIARDRGSADVVDTFFDLLVEENLGVIEVHPGPTEAALPKFVRHPLGMVGTDSTFIGDKPSPRTYGSFTRILGEFVREEAYLSLPEAVRKFTSFPAQRLGLRDRGLLRDGAMADITVFDPHRVRATATYDEPRQLSTGIEYVLVNGELVLDRGRHTGARPGLGLRRGR
ncbi:N-acyl-D-amino-acid deacylase family protein [Geodermatophilus sp. URMC 64]